MGKIKFTDSQQKVIELRNNNLLVAAAAGSGKTAVLVERICERVMDKEHPMDIDELLVVTFTNAAAAEMRMRVMRALEERLKQDPANEHLQKQISLVQGALITTIDGFCLQFLKEHFYLLDLEPGFRICDENEAKLMKEDVLSDVMNSFYQEGSKEFLDFVENYAEGKNDNKLTELVENLYNTAIATPWPKDYLEKCLARYNEGISAPEDIALIKEALLDGGKRIRDCYQMLKNAGAACEQMPGFEKLAEDFEKHGALLEGVKDATTYQEFYDFFNDFEFARMPIIKTASEAEKEEKEQLKATRNLVKKELEDLMKTYFLASPERVVKDHLAMASNVTVLCRLTKAYMEGFAEEKKKRNVVDFSDVEHMTLEILYDDEKKISKVAEDYAKRFKEVMIDEYQDSNYLQEEILTAISGSDNNADLFMVGDVKQSIYRFRQAEPNLFISKYDTFSYEDSPNQKIDLDKNFRSREEILRFSNMVFDSIMQRDLGGIAYDEHASLKYGAEQTYNRDLDDLYETEVVVIDNASLEMDKEEAEAIAVANRVMQLKENGKVTGKDGYRDVEYSDIVILLRQKSMAPAIAAELEKRNIPVITMEGTGYFQRVEVSYMLSMLKIIDNSRQDIPMAAVLNSPMVGLKKSDLGKIAANHKDLPFYEAVYAYDQQDEIKEKLEAFELMLKRFKEKATYLPIHELIKYIYDETGYYHYVSLMPLGEKRRMNLDILVERAKSYGNTSYHGLFNFLRYIDKLKEYDIDLSEGNVSDGQNAVRLMSIHKSKGLEFPMVIVAGLGKQFNKTDLRKDVISDSKYGVALRYTDSKKRIKKKTATMEAMKGIINSANLAEEIRVLYVALTRAKEKLVLVGSVRNLEKTRQKALSMYDEKKRLFYSARLKAACFYDLILPVVFENMAHTKARFTVTEPNFEAMKPAEKMEKAYEEDLRTEKWQRPAYTREGQKKLKELFDGQYHHQQELSLKIKMSVSDIKHHFMELAYEKQEDVEEEPAFLEPAEETATIPGFMGKVEEENRGALYGTITHRILECLDFAGPWTEQLSEDVLKDEIEKIKKEGLISEEYRQMVNVKGILKLLTSELGKEMILSAKDGMLVKEQPFVMGIQPVEAGIEMDTEDLVLVQGIIDVFMEKTEGIVLVDYKTDRVKSGEELIKRYRKQMELYKEALEKSKGKKVIRVVLYSFALGEIIDVPM
ncbi:MAG: helicase-exonuclease AddAB subunit AddA [Lachnospiraceae bacterium]|nr:helicase-exonuclease AddAB subunit AddA [Lachnospiraceae bacterium]